MEKCSDPNQMFKCEVVNCYCTIAFSLFAESMCPKCKHGQVWHGKADPEPMRAPEPDRSRSERSSRDRSRSDSRSDKSRSDKSRSDKSRSGSDKSRNFSAVKFSYDAANAEATKLSSSSSSRRRDSDSRRGRHRSRSRSSSRDRDRRRKRTKYDEGLRFDDPEFQAGLDAILAEQNTETEKKQKEWDERDQREETTEQEKRFADEDQARVEWERKIERDRLKVMASMQASQAEKEKLQHHKWLLLNKQESKERMDAALTLFEVDHHRRREELERQLRAEKEKWIQDWEKTAESDSKAQELIKIEERKQMRREWERKRDQQLEEESKAALEERLAFEEKDRAAWETVTE